MKKKYMFIFLLVMLHVSKGQSEMRWLDALPGNNRVEDLYTLDNTLFLAVKGGIFSKTTNSGRTWITNGLEGYDTFYKIKFITQQKGYIFGKKTNGKSSLIITNDGGLSWNEVEEIESRELNDWEFLSSDTIFVSANSGIVFRSFDSGNSWEKINTQLEYNMRELTSSENGMIYITGVTPSYSPYNNKDFKSVLFCSDDLGKLWKPLYNIDNQLFKEIKVVTEDSLLIATQDDLYMWSVENKSWTLLKQVNYPTYKGEIRKLSIEGNIIFVFTGGGIYYSPDSGTSWDYRVTPYNNFTTSYSYSNNYIYAAGKHLVRSTDHGLSWLRLNEATGMYGGDVVKKFDDQTLGVVKYGNNIHISSDTGKSWQKIWEFPRSYIKDGYYYGIYKDISFVNSRLGVAVYNGGEAIRFYYDGEAPRVEKIMLEPNWHRFYEVEMFSDSSGVIFGADTCFFRTSDGGKTWSKQFYEGYRWSNIVKPDSENFYAVHGGLFHSSDNGETWEKVIVNQEHIIEDITFVSKYAGFCTISGDSVGKTTDGGITWRVKPLGRNLKHIEFANEEYGVITDEEGGLYKTTDGGENWTYNRFIRGHFDDIDVLDDSYFATFENGFIICSESKNMTNVVYNNGDYSDNSSGKNNIDFILSQNYPNPFNPSTNIKFSVKEAGLYKLSVYNMLGEEVKVLVNKQLPAGEYTETFKADGLSSGVYIYRLSGEKINLANKMILLR